MMDRREYEERYGEHVGTCKIHGTVIDHFCEPCEGFPEWLSECCSAPPIEAGGIGIDESTIPYGGPSGFCSRCHDNCIFNDARYADE